MIALIVFIALCCYTSYKKECFKHEVYWSGIRISDGYIINDNKYMVYDLIWSRKKIVLIGNNASNDKYVKIRKSINELKQYERW